RVKLSNIGVNVIGDRALDARARGVRYSEGGYGHGIGLGAFSEDHLDLRIHIHAACSVRWIGAVYTDWRRVGAAACGEAEVKRIREVVAGGVRRPGGDGRIVCGGGAEVGCGLKAGHAV